MLYNGRQHDAYRIYTYKVCFTLEAKNDITETLA